MFAVEDQLKLGGKKTGESPAVPAPSATKQGRPRPEVKPVARIQLKATPGLSIEEAWDRYFASFANASEQERREHNRAVRQTVRELMKAEKFQEVVSLILAALRHGQPQPWMYEGLGLAMQAADAPKADLERALMSALSLKSTAYLGEGKAMGIFRSTGRIGQMLGPFVFGWIIAAACFFGGYAAQFIGHAVERSMPVLVRHPVQANLAAPFFTVVELFKIVGLRDDLFQEVQRQIEQRRQETA